MDQNLPFDTSDPRTRLALQLLRLQILTPLSVLINIATNLVCALVIKPSLSDVSEQHPTTLTPRSIMVGLYMVIVYVLLIGYCVLLVTAGKEETKATLVNGVGLRLVVINWLMTAWAVLWSLQLFLPSTIVLGLIALLLLWINISLIPHSPGGPLTRPFDHLFIHAPLRLWLLITLTLDFPQSLFLALGWGYPINHPESYARKQWEAFAFIMAFHLCGILWVAFRRDLVWTLGGMWVVLSIGLERPKPVPVFASVILFAILYPLTYISVLAWHNLKKRDEDAEGRIQLPPDAEDDEIERTRVGSHVAGQNGANGTNGSEVWQDRT